MRLDLEVKMASQLTDSNSDRYRAISKGNPVNGPSELLDRSAPMTGSGYLQDSVVNLTPPKVARDRSSRGLAGTILLKAIEYQDNRRELEHTVTVEYPRDRQLLLRMVILMLSKAIGSRGYLQLRGNLVMMVKLKTARHQGNWQIENEKVSLK